MAETQELIEIRGKNGTRVPVICPEEVVGAMKYLANSHTRKNAGIKDGNIYLFANTALDVVRAGDSIDELRSRCGLKFPLRIHATNLRKYCATIAQVIGLKDHELKWLCRHLGHTMQVHEQHYRSTSGLIERLDIAKLMLIQERNLVAKFEGKSLKDIKFEDILQDGEENAEVTGAPEVSAAPEATPSDPSALEEDTMVKDYLDDGEDILATRKKPKKSTRKAWTKLEEEELHKFLPEYFSGKSRRSCPTQKDCLRAMQLSRENDGCLHLRGWETIKKKVYNTLLKC